MPAANDDCARCTHLRKPRLPLFGRLVEAAPTAGGRGPASELFALVHRWRAQAAGLAALGRALQQRVHVQVGVVNAGDGRVATDVLEHGVVQVVGRGQVALRVERLRLAADVRVRAVDAAHLIARTPLAAARRRAVRLRLERPHLDAEWRPQVACRIRRQMFSIQVFLHLLRTCFSTYMRKRQPILIR